MLVHNAVNKQFEVDLDGRDQGFYWIAHAEEAYLFYLLPEVELVSLWFVVIHLDDDVTVEQSRPALAPHCEIPLCKHIPSLIQPVLHVTVRRRCPIRVIVFTIKDIRLPEAEDEGPAIGYEQTNTMT